MHLYYDRSGRPISLDEWTRNFRLNRSVAQTHLGRLGYVSTVFLGLNHAWDDGPPLLFETLVFGGPLDETMERYTTEEQARIGHEFMIMRLTTLAGRPPKDPPLIHNGRKPRGKA